MKINFNQLFESNDDGTIHPKGRVRIGGVTIGTGVAITPGVSYGGIDLSQFTTNDFDVDTEGDLTVIRGIHT